MTTFLTNALRQRHLRDAFYFFIALAGTTAFAVTAWLLLSAVLHIPSTAEAMESLGVIKGLEKLVKPEPVENYTFLFSCGVGALLFAFAGHRSAFPRSDPGPVAKLCALSGLIFLAVWLWLLRWDTIVPPAPSALILVSAAKPAKFFVLMVVAAALVAFAVKYEKSRWGRRLYLALGFLPLLQLSRMVLMTGDDSYITTTHYEVFVYPIIQDWLNSGIHLSQKSQYGMYPIFLRPLWHLVGSPTTGAISMAMSLLLLLSNAAMLVFMCKFNGQKTLAIMSGLSAIVFSLLFYPFWPGDAYFEFFPIRLVFPSLAMALLSWKPTRLKYVYLSYVVLAFGPFWNFESGLVGLVMFGVFSVAVRFKPKWRQFLHLLIRQAAAFILALTVAAISVTSYYLVRFGEVPRLGGMLTMIKAFSSGIGAEPMPEYGAWMIHVVVYGLSVVVGIRWLFKSPQESSREQAAALLAVAAMGLLWLRYYQGRSVPLPLAFASFPAILCIGMLVNAGISGLSRYRLGVSICLAALFGAPLLSAMLLWTASNPFPRRGLDRPLHEAITPYSSAVADRVIEKFTPYQSEPGDELVVIAPYAHLVQLKLGKANPMNVAGMCQFWFDSELNQLAALLRNEQTKMVVFDENNSCKFLVNIVNDERIKTLLASDFVQLPPEDGCSILSLSNQVIFVRGATVTHDKDIGIRMENLALGRAAQESSSFGSSIASSAVDGKTDGRFGMGSTTHTSVELDPWWQVDLGHSTPIGSVQIWNRTDCCSDRLKDYWVFTSDKPFEPGERTKDLVRRTDVHGAFQSATPCPSTTVRLAPQSGRYVRVQIAGTTNLSLAEVKVFGPSANLK